MAHEFKTENEVAAVFEKVGDEGLHGDVIVTKTNHTAIFERFPVVKDNALAYGEFTGHSHTIFADDPSDFELRENPETRERHLRVVRPVSLRHQEHNPVRLPPGDYSISIQREYDPFEKLTRRVAD